MPDLTLGDLVANRTMSPEMAATLATAGAERRSLLFVARPRMAGKTTTMTAALAHAPEGTAFHRLTEEAGDHLGIPAEGDGGYLVMSEIADTPFPDYLWGDPVRRVFSALGRGFSLATALHAGGAEEAFGVICAGNEVPDDQAARIDLVVYIRSIGEWREPDRRAVATMHEVEGIEGGEPRLRLLHRWDEAADRFEAVEAPRRIGSEDGGLERRAREFAASAP